MMGRKALAAAGTAALVAGCGSAHTVAVTTSTVTVTRPSNPQPHPHRAAGTSPTTTTTPTPPRRAASIQHVVLIMMENTGYNQIVGNTSQAPYINKTLLSSSGVNAGLATNYYAGSSCQHPSYPNYLEITSGSDHGNCSDGNFRQNQFSVNNIFHQLPGGQSETYAEDMSGNCSTSGSGNYFAYHNVELAYSDVSGDCRNYDVPFSSGSSYPTQNFPAKFTFVVPNASADGGDHGSISTGDTFLSRYIPAAMASPQYRAGNTTILITYDEDEGSEGGHVVMIEVRPSANGFRDGTAYTHASTLAAIENLFGVPRLGDAKTATPLGSDFGLNP